MEKLLAMSFISAPMDFSGPAWIRARMPSPGGRPASTAGRSNPSAAEDRKEDGASRCATTTPGGGGEGRISRTKPHLALEFDGLHCFETFVIH